MRHFLRFVFVVMLFTGFSSARAEQDLVGGAGWFDFNRSHQTTVYDFMGEWRGDSFFYDLRPVLGLQVNTNGGIYGFGGFDYDWQFLPHWYLVPELDVGAWDHNASIQLGGVFEFHEAMEMDYRFDNNDRIGAQISHTSNAHIYNNNPGVNQILAVFTVPFTFAR